MTPERAAVEQVPPGVEAWHPPSARERLAILQRTRTVAIVGRVVQTLPGQLLRGHLSAQLEHRLHGLVRQPSGDIDSRPCRVSEPGRPARGPRPGRRLPERRGSTGRGSRRGGGGGHAPSGPSSGLWSDEAAAIAHGAGLAVVMNRCVKIEHARFAGGLHLAGFDTGVISSRRPGSLGAHSW